MSEFRARLLAKVAHIFNHLNNSEISKASVSQQAHAFALIFKSIYGNDSNFDFELSSISPHSHEVIIKALNLRVVYPHGLVFNNKPTDFNFETINANELSDVRFDLIVNDLKSSIHQEFNIKGSRHENLKRGIGILESFIELNIQHDDYVSNNYLEFIQDCLHRISNSNPDLIACIGLANLISVNNVENELISISKNTTESLWIKRFVVLNKNTYDEFIFDCDFANMSLIYTDSDSNVCNIKIPPCSDDFMAIQPNEYIISRTNSKLAKRENLKGGSRFGEFEHVFLLMISLGYYLKISDYITHGLTITTRDIDELISCKNKDLALDALLDIFNMQDNSFKLKLIGTFLSRIDLKGNELVSVFSNKIIESQIDIVSEIDSCIMPASGFELKIQENSISKIRESQVYTLLLSDKMVRALDDVEIGSNCDSIQEINDFDNDFEDTLSL
ncbi:hypothetical protein OCF84_21130 (plasmid) [Shewanella xiamenensis]|uniref:Uncharacterized protein n=1 Tax=Shewanella xiamenensis TaxID=332186 RepID=A0ABT6UE06_9GAMM|nr:hypothetical protein [Shewanella xiamenensis]MDI5832621.1 hypothetical protein [Shewanella xiamenensis]WHF57762.1 hypothetical protein OCF84_21130 [Shewanella xiamenensis]